MILHCGIISNYLHSVCIHLHQQPTVTLTFLEAGVMGGIGLVMGSLQITYILPLSHRAVNMLQGINKACLRSRDAAT